MISATLESKTKGDLTKEGKNTDMTWDDMDLTLDESNGTWENPLLPGSLESKTKGDLSLESKT
jgi:hypothetical protein